MKKCPDCGIEKDEEQYYNKTKKTKFAQCKECTCKRMRLKRNPNPKQKPVIPDGHSLCTGCDKIKPISEFRKQTCKKHKKITSACKQCLYKGHIPWEDKDLPRKQFNYYVAKAKARKLAWHLTIREFHNIVSKPCTYCGSETSLSHHGIGVDRIDSSIGYEVSNCVPCCTICNWMKNSLTVQAFHEHIAKVYFFEINKASGTTTV